MTLQRGCLVNSDILLPVFTLDYLNYYFIGSVGSQGRFRQLDFLSNLSTSYLFLICYIKENNVYKIKFNDAVKTSFSSNEEGVSYKLSHLHWSILPTFCTVFIGSHKMDISIIEDFCIKIVYNNKVYLYQKEDCSSISSALKFLH